MKSKYRRKPKKSSIFRNFAYPRYSVDIKVPIWSETSLKAKREGKV